MCCRNSLRILTCCALITGSVTMPARAQWTPHTVRQLNGTAPMIPVPAKLQIVTKEWDRLVTEPYLVYMPEKNRLLISVIRDTIKENGNEGVNWPRKIVMLFSDDGGEHWTEPRDAVACTGLTYLGNGKVMASTGSRWLSEDYGETWRAVAPTPTLPNGKVFNRWDPMLVDRDPGTGKVVRLVEAGYEEVATPHPHAEGCLRFSNDEGRTWPTVVKVPQWVGMSEIALARAGNGDLIAAGRTDPTTIRDSSKPADFYCGLGVSVSEDNGSTWSPVSKLYDWGRMFPSMALMPNNDLVMSYVVRLGYADTADGFPQFGIEAVVSHDHGRTWDLDHRYLLHTWVGKQKDRWFWWGACICTSTVLMPDGSILTSFGTGERTHDNPHVLPIPSDVGLVQWRLGDQPLKDSQTIHDAPPDSDLRNLFNPATGEHGSVSGPDPIGRP